MRSAVEPTALSARWPSIAKGPASRHTNPLIMRSMNIGLHLRVTGRPARFAAVLGILRLLQDLGSRVWIARRIDIARALVAENG